MKPTKNRVHCAACGKPKMLFETQDKADNFIKHNGDEILEETGKTPTRSYYCELCGGFHVTSIDSVEVGARLDQRVQLRVADYKKSVEFENRVSFFNEKLAKANLAIPDEMNECANIIEACEFELELLAKDFITASEKIDKLRKNLDRLKNAKRSAEKLFYSSTDKQISFIKQNKHLKTKSVKRLIRSLKRKLMSKSDKLSPEDLLFLSQIV